MSNYETRRGSLPSCASTHQSFGSPRSYGTPSQSSRPPGPPMGDSLFDKARRDSAAIMRSGAPLPRQAWSPPYPSPSSGLYTAWPQQATYFDSRYSGSSGTPVGAGSSTLYPLMGAASTIEEGMEFANPADLPYPSYSNSRRHTTHNIAPSFSRHPTHRRHSDAFVEVGRNEQDHSRRSGTESYPQRLNPNLEHTTLPHTSRRRNSVHSPDYYYERQGRESKGGRSSERSDEQAHTVPSEPLGKVSDISLDVRRNIITINPDPYQTYGHSLTLTVDLDEIPTDSEQAWTTKVTDKAIVDAIDQGIVSDVALLDMTKDIKEAVQTKVQTYLRQKQQSESTSGTKVQTGV